MMIIAATQSIFKLELPDFQWQQIYIIPTDDNDNNDDNNNSDDGNGDWCNSIPTDDDDDR